MRRAKAGTVCVRRKTAISSKRKRLFVLHCATIRYIIYQQNKQGRVGYGETKEQTDLGTVCRSAGDCSDRSFVRDRAEGGQCDADHAGA